MNIVNDVMAVVTTDTCSDTLVLLDIVGRRLSINRTVKIDFTAVWVSVARDNFVITCPFTEPPSVKLVDRLEKSSGMCQQGRPLFRLHMSFCYNDYAEIPTVVVATTIGNDRLVLLNAETGEVITTRHLAEKNIPVV